MTVTRIEELTKTRCRIYIDGEPAFVLYKGEMSACGVTEGGELAPERYEDIMTRILPSRAKLRAMNLLKNREYTSRQLHDKLKEGGYPEGIITQALDYVASFHYTDDLRYAVSYIMCHEDSRSRRRIEQDLIGKGIDKSTLEKAWSQWEEQGGEQDEEAMIRKLLIKRGYDSETADAREKARQGSFLMRRGFSMESIMKCLT